MHHRRTPAPRALKHEVVAGMVQSTRASSPYARTEGIETSYADFAEQGPALHHRRTPAPRALKLVRLGRLDDVRQGIIAVRPHRGH